MSDPWGHVLSNEYLPLHDPHLKELFNSPRMKRHLVRKQFITRDGKVICNLKDFNQYRRYLRRICLMEIARERMMKDEGKNDARRTNEISKIRNEDDR
ncbi:hypothetical protein KUTeg_005875 [Tegillarca granosa]|uniref:Uncharacterized protein n=1 Tax=Tegillarca granosa TaxID=220873 RepID=A0ABQ9FIU2_TEGGR|nr:hypothetical protein KUTeg_005875 [Tegillarca granosa]